MKKNNFIKRALVALTFAVAVAVMVPAAGSVEAQAAKKVTAQKTFKKAKSVKTGTTTVTVKKRPANTNYNDAYVKFKAPKAGKYVFTVSSLKLKGQNPATSTTCGFFYLGKLSSSGKYIDIQKLKTAGGKTTYMQIGTKTMYEYSVRNKLKKIDQYLTSRSATISLKKGETVYLNIICTTSQQYTYKLKVKRK